MSWFIDTKSEAFFKSGLAKSAFHVEKLYEGLPLDYYLPFISSTQRTFFALKQRVYPKFYQAHDAFLMYYKPYHLVYGSLKRANKVAPIWRSIVEKAVNDRKFLSVNRITAGSTELSIISAVKFLQTILNFIDVEDVQKLLKQAQQGSAQPNINIKDLINDLERVVSNAIDNALEAVQEYKVSVEESEEAISTLMAGSGGHGFTKEVLSVLRFLERPNEFRKRVRILRYARFFLTQFLATVPTSLVHQQIISVYGGINGVTKMFSDKQLQDLLPSELVLTQLGDAGRALFAVKAMQKQLMVYQKASALKPVIFVDKSGSMAEDFSCDEKVCGENRVPKISVATGLALALYRKLGAEVYLFDTEVEKVNPSKVVDVLLTVSADGGTNIDSVLEEILSINKKDYLYVIISDGITEANEEIMKKWIESGLDKRTKLLLVPPSGTSYKWVDHLRKLGNVVYAENVMELMESWRKVLNA